MDEFARKTTNDRDAYFEEAASRRDLNSIIIEKDFWVCWTLKRLMGSTGLAKQLTFKGGTSLSKAYGLIDRFSEDVDLTISKTAPLISDVKSPLENGIGRNERDRRSQSLKEAAQRYVATVVMPLLTQDVAAALNTNDEWSIVLDPDDGELQTLLFNYPKSKGHDSKYTANSNSAGQSYIQPRIKLEFGVRGDSEPSHLKTIKPYLAEEFPSELPNAGFEVLTLSVIRTFWEKVTILHALHHNGKLRKGMSRHYYDTLMLAQSGIANTALQSPDLLQQVVLNKTWMFADKSASYETAVLGSLRLVPSDETILKLKQDYREMADMFMTAPPSFEELLAGILEIEQTLNQK